MGSGVRLIAVALLVWQTALPVQSTDVKVRVRTTTELHRGIGGYLLILTGASGGGREATIARKGSRLKTDWNQLIDFGEQKTYESRPGGYALTFPLMRQRLGNNRRDLEFALDTTGAYFQPADLALPHQSRKRAKRFTYLVQIKETGAQKRIANYDTQEIAITVTATEQGKHLERDGGWIATSNVWLAARMPVLDELAAAHQRYYSTMFNGIFDAVYYGLSVTMTSTIDIAFPEHSAVAARVMAEIGKLNGTPLATATSYVIVATAAETKRAEQADRARQKQLKEAGLVNDRLSTRFVLLGVKQEFVSIATTVTDEDLALPVPVFIKKG